MRPIIKMRPEWINPTAIAVPAGIIVNIPGRIDHDGLRRRYSQTLISREEAQALLASLIDAI